MQVVTSENFQTLVETGKVPEFVAPKADPKVEVTVEKTEAKTDERPRGEDGKFLPKDKEAKADDAEQASFDEDLRDPSIPMPEKVRRQIARKHVEMRKAEGATEILRAERQAERDRADRAEASLRTLQEERNGKAAPAKDSNEPKAEDYKTVGEYAEALAEYKVEKKFAERDARREQEQREQAMQVAQAAHQKRIEATAKAIPDYEEIVDKFEPDIPPHILVYIAESPIGPRLGYELAKPENRAEYDRISKLSPIRAIAELGKLEDRLEKPKAKDPEEGSEPATRTVSRAPSPITPLEGNASTVQKDPAKMSLQELRAHENAQRAAKAARR